MKYTRYFAATQSRPDHAIIEDEWIKRVMDNPVREHVQDDGRIRRWAHIDGMGGRYLRIILLPDGETVHNAFFDRSLKP